MALVGTIQSGVAGAATESSTPPARSAPAIIRGNWEPSRYLLPMIEEDAERLHALGVNTIAVPIEGRLGRDGMPRFRAEESIEDTIDLVRAAGFAVLLTPNFSGSHGIDFERDGIRVSTPQFQAMAEDVALRWAAVAERHGVEFFAPFSEFDDAMEALEGHGADHPAQPGERSVWLVLSGLWQQSLLPAIRSMLPESISVWASWLGPSRGPAVELTGSWHRGILPKLRSIFHGRLVAKLAHVDPRLDVTGYDLVAITVLHGNESVPQLRRDLRIRLGDLRYAARRSQARWFIGEAALPFGGYWPNTTNHDGESLDELQDDYLQVFADAYEDARDERAAGLMFVGYRTPGLVIKDRPAEAVLRSFFAQLRREESLQEGVAARDDGSVADGALPK